MSSDDKDLMQCSVCPLKFTLKSNLTRHLRMVHNIHIERKDICPGDFDLYHFKCLEGCQISFKYNRDLRNHLKDKHQLDLVELNLEFPNSEAFKKWLKAEEAANCVQYIHLTATKKKSTGARTFYYECNRTGKRFTIDDKARRRKPRKMGTIKLNRGCTSQIIVNVSYDGSYSVNYFKSHYAHDIGLEHVKLSKQDRGAIASKLLLGIPVSSVMHSVKNTNDERVQRINLLRRKDVFNIRRSFNTDGKFSEMDALNIQAFFDECSTLPHDPILCNKVANISRIGEVCLIIMTERQAQVLSEFGSNQIFVSTMHLSNCGLELATLFVVAPNGDTFPAAVMFTDNNTYDIYKLFFAKIAEQVGKITSRVFVSDCNEMYAKAWTEVMGAAEYEFYNEAEIDIDWKSGLNRILCADNDVNKVKRKWMYDTLKILQKISDEQDFQDIFDETLTILRNDADFNSFLEYFQSNYADPKKWADCYRCEIATKNIQVALDVLRQYLNEEQEMRVNKIFQNLMRYIRDETVNSMLKNAASRVAFVEENNKRHELSTRNAALTNVGSSNDIWNVRDSNRTYVVEKCLETNCCDLVCSNCHICIHAFSCTCVDFFIGNVICEHIHYIKSNYFESVVVMQVQADAEDSSEEIIIRIESDQADRTDRVNGLKCEIRRKLTKLQNDLAAVNSESSLETISSRLNELCELAEDEKSKLLNEDIVMGDHSYV